MLKKKKGLPGLFTQIFVKLDSYQIYLKLPYIFYRYTTQRGVSNWPTSYQYFGETGQAKTFEQQPLQVW